MSDIATSETPHARSGGCGCGHSHGSSGCGCGGAHSHAKASSSHSGCGCRGIRGLRRTHALLGAVLIIFVALHFAASATAFFPARYESLALFLRDLVEKAPPLQLGLFALLAAQAVTGILLLKRSGLRLRSARCQGDSPLRYFIQRWSGLIIFVFLVVHIAMAKLRIAHPDVASVREGLFAGNGFLIALYVLAVAATLFHLANGTWTAASVWGLRDARPRAWLGLSFFLGILLATLGVLALWPFIT